MGQTPDEIRAEIEATRSDLTTDVDALADKVSPARIAQRRVGAARTAVTGVKDKVMGQASSAKQGTQGTASSVASTVGSAASSVGSAASSLGDVAASAPGQLTRQAQGAPLAAGFVAFGVGLLVGSLMPATDTEREAGRKVRESAQPVVDSVKDAATEAAQSAKEQLQPAAQQAVQSVKDTAQEGVSATKEHAQQATEQVKGDAQQAAGDVKDTARDSAQTVRSETGSSF